MTRRFMTDHVFVDVVGDATQQAATTVTHKAVLVPRSNDARASLLEDIISVELSQRQGQVTDEQQNGGGRVIVFTATKRECDELAGGPAFQRLSAQVLHGDIGQSQREATLAQFRRGQFSVLVATDVAARGIDVKGVDLVVQFRRLGPPSAGRVLEAASLDAARALTRVQDDVVPHFLETAKQLCADELAETSDEAASLVARCLAAVARQNELRARSVLTGEADRTTLLMSAPRPLKTSDVVYAVSKLLERVPKQEGA